LTAGEGAGASSDRGFRPAGGEETYGEASSDAAGANGDGAPLSDRLRVRPRGAASRAEGRPTGSSYRERDAERSTSGAELAREARPDELAGRPDDPLRARRDLLLADLERYRGRDERDLRDGDRLAKHRIQSQLIALHFLLDGDEDLAALDDLLESLDAPSAPGRVHSLLRAALYESVDLEERSAAVLGELAGRGGGGLRISAPVPCSAIEGLGRYQPDGRDRFRPGDSLRLYCDVYGLENERIGTRYRPRLEVGLALLDRGGVERDRVAIATEAQPTAEPVADSYLVVPYTLPREIPFGEARLVLTVKDALSGATARQERTLRIAP